MKSPRILITGASGYIGRSLYSHLIDLEPVGVYFNSIITPPAPNWIQADLRNDAEVSQLLQHYQPDVLFHCAALPSPRINKENPQLAEETNVGVTKNIVGHLPKSTHLLFLSSDVVFNGEDRAPTEDTSTQPLTLHGQLKVHCEKLICETHARYHILRLATVHGLGDSSSHSFIDRALINLAKGEQVYSFHNISRCYTRIGELLDVLKRLISDKHYGIYNLGSPLKSYFDRMRDLCEETGIEWRGNLLAASGDVLPKTQNLNTEKIRKLLNCTFT